MPVELHWLRPAWLLAIPAVLVVAMLLLGVLTAFIGLIARVPIIGYAAWHGYLETIDADAFPRHAVGITSTPRSEGNAQDTSSSAQ